MRHKHADLLIYAAENADAEFIHDQLDYDPNSICPSIRMVLELDFFNWKIKPKTETRWQWAYRYDQGNEWFITADSCTEDGLKSEGLKGKIFKKLEFTAKEFKI